MENIVKPSNTWATRKRQFLDLIPKATQPNAKLLDIATPFIDDELVQSIQQHGYNYTGADLEPADKRISQQNIFNLLYQPHTFDVVLTSHTLEHLPDFHSAILQLAKVVKPDGYIYIRVPVNHEKYHQRIYIGHPRKGCEHAWNLSIYQMDYDIKNLLNVIDYKEYPITHEAAWLCKFKKIEHYPNYN